MPVTVKVNGTAHSLVHKGSNGISVATVPDVCKTPSPGGPIPIPYPNISQSATLAKGTTTVKADGGMMIANKGSEFSLSNGDNPGVAGGVKSSTFMKESTWILYSFDVKMDGQNACRLTDKKFQNHENTVDLGGVLQPAVIMANADVVAELQTLCNMMCDIKDQPGPKQKLIADRLKAVDKSMGGRSTMKAEVPFDPKSVTPYMSSSEPWRATNNWWITGHRRPDVVITDGGPPVLDNIRRVVEMKFNDASTGFSKEQNIAYRRMFGKKFITLEEGVDCVCDDKKPKKQPEPVPAPIPIYVPEPGWWEKAKKVGLIGGAAVLGIATVAAFLSPFDGPVGEMALGSATLATWNMAFAN